MPLNCLDHYLIRARDIEKSKQFYIEVLGMKVGYRPPFSFPGYWLYVENKPVVHLVQAPVNIEIKDILSTEISQTSSAISHIAFSASDLEGMLKHLSKLGIPLKHFVVPEENGADQIFIADPDGIKIELNFSK